MRTTVSISDDLIAAAKSLAQHRGTTLGRVIEDALRRELAERRDASRPAVPMFQRGTGPRPGVDLRSNRALAELLDPVHPVTDQHDPPQR